VEKIVTVYHFHYCSTGRSVYRTVTDTSLAGRACTIGFLKTVQTMFAFYPSGGRSQYRCGHPWLQHQHVGRSAHSLQVHARDGHA